MNREEAFEKIYDTYCTWYNMERCDEGKTPHDAFGAFHASDEAYLLLESMKMWTADSNDYLYIFNIPHLTLSKFHELTEYAKVSGQKFIKPAKNHKSSYITALFICDTADEDAHNALKKYRYRKDFAFGFKGWEEVHTTIFTVEDEIISSNRDGSNTAKFLQNVFYPKKQGFFNKFKGV